MPSLRPPDPPFMARKFSTGERNVHEWGEIDLTGKRDCSYTLNQAFADAAEYDDIGLVMPAGQMKISQPLVYRSATPRLRGLGARSIIRPDDNDFDWFTVGSGTDGQAPFGPNGWIDDIHLVGMNTTKAPPGTKVGLCLDGARFVQVARPFVQYASIAYDMKKNCFGSQWIHPCSGTFDECRIGMVVRGQNVSGSDIPIYYPWLRARECGLWVEGLQGGITTIKGQISAGENGTPNDNLGSVVIGSALDTTVGQGSVQVNFVGTSFEWVKNYWNVRCFGVQGSPNGIQATFDNCNFDGETNAKGVLKLTEGYDDVIAWRQCFVQGTYTEANLISVNLAPGGLNARPFFSEEGTTGTPICNGVPVRLLDGPMVFRAQLESAHARWGWVEQNNGLLLRWNGGSGTFEKSSNWGGAWSAV